MLACMSAPSRSTQPRRVVQSCGVSVFVCCGRWKWGGEIINQAVIPWVIRALWQSVIQDNVTRIALC